MYKLDEIRRTPQNNRGHPFSEPLSCTWTTLTKSNLNIWNLPLTNAAIRQLILIPVHVCKS